MRNTHEEEKKTSRITRFIEIEEPGFMTIPIMVPSMENIRVPATKEAIDKLNRYSCKDCPDQKCTICVEDFSSKDGSSPILEMPCGHKFCQDCLLPWLEEHHNCPTC